MKVTPMIFNTEMVRALLEGRKTVTRRPIKIPYGWKLEELDLSRITSTHPKKGKWGVLICKGIDTQFPQRDLSVAPCYIGDLIYVRETFEVQPPKPFYWVQYKAGGDNPVIQDDEEVDSKTLATIDKWANHLPSGWCPSIHMPRKLSRLTLKITGVHIEPVQNITDEDAVCEGMPTAEEAQQMAIDAGMSWYQKPQIWFKQLWEKLYENWEENPYVWVIEFEVIHQNVDKYLIENKGK